jgi:uncharacterized protein (TIGR02145 family)
MKKTSSILFALTLGIGAVWGQSPLEKVDFHMSDGRIIVGDTIDLVVDVTPENHIGYWDIVTYSPNIVKLWQDENGWHIQPLVKEEKFTLESIWYNSGGQEIDWITKFFSAIQPVDSVSITPNPSTLTIAKGDEVTFTATTYPATATYPKMSIDGIGPQAAITLVGDPVYSGEHQEVLTFTVKALEVNENASIWIKGDSGFFLKGWYITIADTTVTYSISASAGNGGTIYPSGDIAANLGASQIFNVTPDFGKMVDKWIVNGNVVAASGNSYTVYVTQNTTVNVTFKDIPPAFTVSVSAGAGGVITPNGQVTITQGTNQQFIATPDAGKKVDLWIVNGNVVATSGNSYTVTNVQQNTTVNVTFKNIPSVETATTDPGVKINGVTWATRNVSAPGYFTDRPEDAGALFQWGIKAAWSATDPLVNSNGGTYSEWITYPEGDTWEAANDPCPSGWHVPTIDEFESITALSGSKTITLNGTYGRLITTNTGDSLFFPGTYSRFYGDGGLRTYDVDKSRYWSSSPSVNNSATNADFWSITDNFGGTAKGYGYPLRCVASINIEEETTAAPADTTVTITWLPVSGTNFYIIIIYADAARTQPVFVILLNSNGELYGAGVTRYGAPRKAPAEYLQYIVEGLDEGTTYYYDIVASADETGNEVLQTYNGGSFTTTESGGVITGTVVPVSERSRTVACYNLLGKKLPKAPDSGIYIIVYDNGKVEKVVK